ncbi:MAG: hypothetical protein IAE80_29130, partial [Anaerolinea sp.]|nr:hypothetical protein [Anaerolinea sp.]
AQTATALAAILQQPTQDSSGGGLIPTQEIVPGATQAFPTLAPTATALPGTGFFDEIAAGGRDGIGLLALAVIGLVGVIVISRRVRSSVSQRTDAESDKPAN